MFFYIFFGKEGLCASGESVTLHPILILFDMANTTSFRKYLISNGITKFLINNDTRVVECFNNKELVKTFFIGQNYVGCNGEDLFNDASIFFDGYEGKDWIYITSEKFGFEVVFTL
jgi:hypothetical protein